MKTVVLANSVSATAVANQTAVSTVVSPFLVGRKVRASIDPSGVTGTPNARIQGSDDNTTFVDLLTNTGLGKKVGDITLYKYMRFGVFTAGGAGVYSADLNADA